MENLIQQLNDQGYMSIADQLEEQLSNEQLSEVILTLSKWQDSLPVCNQDIQQQTLLQQAKSAIDNITNQLILQQVRSALKANWPGYFEALSSLSNAYELASSLKLLSIADGLLNQSQDFAKSGVIERYLIGGVKDNRINDHYAFNTQLLGDMQSFASFKKLIKTDPEGLAKLLRIIPATGPIDGWHYKQFIDSYQLLFSQNGFKQAHLFPATRLLSMKRPGLFISLNQSSATLICQALSIRPIKNQDYQRYWDEIILPIHQAKWYQAEQPADPAQVSYYLARVALFERLLYLPISGSEDISQIKNPGTPNIPNASDLSNIHDKSGNSGDFINVIERPTTMKKPINQPKNMTIKKRQSAKVNRNAATKLMSQYYFDNKAKFSHLDMSASRETIIEKLIAGESVEEAFDQVLAEYS